MIFKFLYIFILCIPLFSVVQSQNDIEAEIKNVTNQILKDEEYYRSIDSTMQKRFPENFGGTDTLEEAKPAQRKPSTVVAPATRSTGPKKVRLTKTQLALAKKFKLTPEQYARELIKTESTNG